MIIDIIKGKKPFSHFKERLDEQVERLKLNRSFKRELLLEALYEQERPVSIEDLFFAVNGGSKRVISINSIYRNVKLFVELNLAVRSEQGGNARFAIASGGSETAELVCRKCGLRKSIDRENPLWRGIGTLLAAEEFCASEGVELHALCSRCASRQ